MVGPSGLEPPTLRLSVVRSSQLSYGPIFQGSNPFEGYTLKIEQCKKIVSIFLRAACASLQDPLLRLLSKLGVALRAPQ